MTNLISIIVSLIVLLIIIYVKDMQAVKSRTTYHGTLYYRLTNASRFLIIFSMIIFIIVCIIDVSINKYDNSWLSVITVVLNALSVAVITLPISVSNIYNSIFREEEKILYTKYVATDIYDKKMIYNFNKAGIKVIILSKEDLNTKIKTVTEKKFKEELLNDNLIIKTNDKKVLKNIDNVIYEFRDLKKCFHKIELARSKMDNVARIVKYNVLTYLPLLLLYFDLVITKYPVYYSILIILLLKLLTALVSEHVYKKMNSDNDLMERTTIIEGRLIGRQEVFFLIATCFIALFCYALPYQFVLSEGGSISLGLTLFLSTFLFNNIFITYALYSESALVKNIVKAFKNYQVILYVIYLIVITILINFIHFLGTKQMGIQNYLSSIIFGFIPVLVIEIVKFARYTTTRGVKKNESKTNKKPKRS